MNDELFDKETENSLRELLSNLKRKVVNYLVTGENCLSCNEAIALARGMNRVSNGMVKFEILDANRDIIEKLMVRYIPGFIYDTKKRNIRFYGIPSGQEFAPFVYIQKYIGNDELTLPKNIIERVESIEKPLHVKIMVTPECPYCPLVVDTLNQIGLVNNQLLIETIEAVEFPDEANIYNITYVPSIIVTRIEDWKILGGRPLEILHGYADAEIIVKVLEKAYLKLKRMER
ncbi:MAG: thioredoxin family protein [Desulfurococcaceae archaeon]|uniref:Glutaredoxin n=1 Tax=Staphylothermus marinus TaxID=2280 RepID=A0A7C4JMF3_STAMA